MTIARNQTEFLNGLFTGPKTADGFIVRKLKRGIKLWALGEDYVLNQDGVFCLATKLNGQTWYSYGGRLNAALSMTQRAELADNIRAMAQNP